MLVVADLDVAFLAQKSSGLPRPALVIQIGTVEAAASGHRLATDRAQIVLTNENFDNGLWS